MIDRAALERALTMRLGPTSRAWQRLADAELAALDLSEKSARALAYLARLRPGTRQGELARAIGIAEPSLVPTIRALEHAGLVSRRADADDRRANHLRLTAEGAALAQEIDLRLSSLRAQMLENVPDEVLTRLVAVLDTFIARIEERRGRP